MKFEQGNFAVHILTNERVLILSIIDNQYLIRLSNYSEVLVKDFELEEYNKPKAEKAQEESSGG